MVDKHPTIELTIKESGMRIDLIAPDTFQEFLHEISH
jgi:hypothetical protein